MPEQRAFVRYGDRVEERAPDEDETVERIIASMTRESEVTAGRYNHAVRASHAKSTGLLKGELQVLEGLPGFLRQGLFAEPRTYPVVVRLAQGPGELLSDSVSTHRGMAIKVFGAEGPKLAGHEGAETQDFVLATGPAFPQADAASFLLAFSRCGRWKRARRCPRRSSRPCPPPPASPKARSRRSAAPTWPSLSSSATRRGTRWPTATTAKRRSGTAITSPRSPPSPLRGS